MRIAATLQPNRAPIAPHEHDTPARRHAADPCDRDAALFGDSVEFLCAMGRTGKLNLVVVARGRRATDGLLCSPFPALESPRLGDTCGLEFDAHTGGPRDMAEIGHEAVGDIDRRCR